MNTNSQANGDNEVHKEGCSHMPNSENQKYLGEFTKCQDAVAAAKQIDSDADGCFYCCKECHTS